MISKINISKFQKLLVLPAVILHAILLFKTTFTLWPEMVVYPYLYNRGYFIYRDIINPYPPLLTVLLAQFAKIFGYTPTPYFILTTSLILIIDLVIFFIAKKITGSYHQAFLSTLFFIILSIPFGINGLWFDLVQTPLILFAFYNFYRFLNDKESKNLLTSFLLIIAAIFIKQQAIWLTFWFILISILNLQAKSILLKNLSKVTAFFLAILLLHVVFFQKIGILKDFLFWTIYYPFFKASSMPGYILFPTFKQLLVLISLLIIFIPAIFLKEKRVNLIVLTAFFLILFAYPRFDYFHLIPSLAILSLAIGPTITLYLKKTFFIKPLILFSILYLSVFSTRYLANNWQKPVRFFEPEIISTANFLSKIVPKDDLIYIQNGPDQLLPLAGLLPPKPWADELPWYLELTGEQQKIVESITKQNPGFVIYKPYIEGNKYDLGAYRPEKIVHYLDENYQQSIQISESLWLKKRK